MGKRKLVAETGGTTWCSKCNRCSIIRYGTNCIYGKEDIQRQQPNVFRMELLGAKVVSVEDGQGHYQTPLIKHYNTGLVMLMIHIIYSVQH